MATGAFTEYSSGITAASTLRGICLGPDGNLWATGNASNKVLKITTGGTVTEYSLPTATGPYGICSDGTNLWVACPGSNYLVKVTTGGSMTEYSMGASKGPQAVCLGPDGNLWVAFNTASSIAKVSTSGSLLNEYATTTGSAAPFSICSDGTNLWSTLRGANKICKTTTSGTHTEYSITSGSTNNPFQIILGPDGNLWFTEQGSGVNKFAKITTGGTITEYSSVSADPRGIATVNGELWIVLNSANKIGRYDTSGSQIAEYSITTAASGPNFIAAGPSGNLWFTEGTANKIAVVGGALTQTQGVAVPAYTQATKTQGVAVNVAHTALRRTAYGRVDYDSMTAAPLSSDQKFAIRSSGALGTYTGGELSVTTTDNPLYLVRTNDTEASHGGVYLLLRKDAAVSIDVTPDASATPTNTDVALAKSGDTNEAYILRVGTASSAVARKTAGVTTDQTTFGSGVAAGSKKRVKLYVKDNNLIGAVVDGTAASEWTDASYINAALEVSLGVEGTSKTAKFDNFTATKGSYVKVLGLSTGEAVRIYDSTDTVVDSAVESSGTATLNLASQVFPFTGYIRVFTDNTYASAVTTWPAGPPSTSGGFPVSTDIMGGDEYSLNPASLSPAVHVVSASKPQHSYATSQGNSHNGLIVNGDNVYGLFTGVDSSGQRRVYAYTGSLTNDAFTITDVDGSTSGMAYSDMHESANIVVDSSGYFHIVYGGSYGNYDAKYRKSTNPWDTSSWGSTTNLGPIWPALLIDQADTLHLFGVKNYSPNYRLEQAIYRQKTSGGSWSSDTILANASAPTTNTKSATSTTGSNVVTIASTTGLAVGDTLTDDGFSGAIIAIGTTITNISGTSVTLSANAAGTGTWSLTFQSVSTPNTWAFYIGDASIGKEPSGQKSIHFLVMPYSDDVNTTGSFQGAYYFRSTDGGTTFETLSGSSLSLPLSQSNSTGALTGGDLALPTGYSHAHMAVESSGAVTVAANVQPPSTTPQQLDIYRGTTSWPGSATSSLTGTNGTYSSNHVAIEQILGNLVIYQPQYNIGGYYSSFSRYVSSDDGVTWTKTANIVTPGGVHDAGAIMWWPKLTPIQGSNLFMLLWHSRYGIYTDTSYTVTGSGLSTSALMFTTVSGVLSADQAVAVSVRSRSSQTQAVAVTAAAATTATQAVAVGVAAASTASISVAVRLSRGAVARSLAVAVTSPAPSADTLASAADWWRRRRRLMTNKSAFVVQPKGTTKTATWTSPTFESKTEAGIIVVLDVTAASGTGGLQVRINAQDPASAEPAPLNTAPTAVSSTGTYSYAVYPFGALSGALTQSTSGYLPRNFSITVTHSDSSSYTYSVGYQLLP